MLGVLHEDEAAAGGGLQAGEAGHGDGAVSEETAAELFGEIAQGLLHGCLLSLYEARVYNAEDAGGCSPFAIGSSCRAALGLDGRGRPSPHKKLNTTVAALLGVSSSDGGPTATGRDS